MWGVWVNYKMLENFSTINEYATFFSFVTRGILKREKQSIALVSEHTWLLQVTVKTFGTLATVR
jgi:hypothetical protein